MINKMFKLRKNKKDVQEDTESDTDTKCLSNNVNSVWELNFLYEAHRHGVNSVDDISI